MPSGEKRDFSNPMYEAMRSDEAVGTDFGVSNASSRSSTMSPSSDAGDFIIGGPAGRHQVLGHERVLSNCQYI